MEGIIDGQANMGPADENPTKGAFGVMGLFVYLIWEAEEELLEILWLVGTTIGCISEFFSATI